MPADKKGILEADVQTDFCGYGIYPQLFKIKKYGSGIGFTFFRTFIRIRLWKISNNQIKIQKIMNFSLKIMTYFDISYQVLSIKDKVKITKLSFHILDWILPCKNLYAEILHSSEATL